MVNKFKKTMGKIFSCIGSKENNKDPDTPLRRKMVIVGDGECGKTCLVTRMCSGEFVDVGYLPTVFETDVVNVSTGKENVDLTIFDTAGQEDYDRLRPFSYHDIDVALVCFSLVDTDTLTNVTDKWSSEVKYFCGNIPIILVGNKKDLRDPPMIPEISENKSSSQSKSASRDDDSINETKFLNDQEDTIELDLSNDNNNNKYNSDDSKSCDQISSTSSIVKSKDETRISRLFSPSSHSIPFHVQAPVKHSEGALIANRIGAIAYFETSALTGDNVEELLLATTKAAVLGSKKSKSFKPFQGTLRHWKSLSRFEQKSKF